MQASMRMHNRKTSMLGGVMHVMIVACPSLAFVFMLLLISHAIITACLHNLYCILSLYFLVLSSQGRRQLLKLGGGGG